MKISVIIPPCFRCLNVCTHCLHHPKEVRLSWAEAALRLLKEAYPHLVPDEIWAEKPGDGGKE